MYEFNSFVHSHKFDIRWNEKSLNTKQDYNNFLPENAIK